MSIAEETAATIEQLIPKILSGQEDSEIEWLSKGNNLVFKLTQDPRLVFKTSETHYSLPRSQISKEESRFQNMIKATEVCMANKLDLLVIPHAKLLTVRAQDFHYTLIAEEITKKINSANASVIRELVTTIVEYIKDNGFGAVGDDIGSQVIRNSGRTTIITEDDEGNSCYIDLASLRLTRFSNLKASETSKLTIHQYLLNKASELIKKAAAEQKSVWLFPSAHG